MTESRYKRLTPRQWRIVLTIVHAEDKAQLKSRRGCILHCSCNGNGHTKETRRTQAIATLGCFCMTSQGHVWQQPRLETTMCGCLTLFVSADCRGCPEWNKANTNNIQTARPQLNFCGRQGKVWTQRILRTSERSEAKQTRAQNKKQWREPIHVRRNTWNI